MCYYRAVVHKGRWAGTQDIAVGIVAFPDFEQNSEGGFDVINASGDIEFDTIPRLQFCPLMKLRRIRRIRQMAFFFSPTLFATQIKSMAIQQTDVTYIIDMFEDR